MSNYGPRVWRLLVHSEPDAARNLAIDEALVRARGAGEAPPTLRLWRNPPCVVVGISQNPFEEVNLGVCEAMSLPVLRRQSGGGAVYHDQGNLNYSLIIDHAALAGHTGTTQSYRFLLQGVIAALDGLGVASEQRNISDVYAGPSKIAGCAQYRTGKAILHHGCILVAADLDALERTLRVPAAWYREVVNLTDISASPHSIERALATAYAALFEVQFATGALTASEECRAEQLYREKYSQRDWHYRVPAGWKPHRYHPVHEPGT